MGETVRFVRRHIFLMNLASAMCVFASSGVAAGAENYCDEQWSEIVSKIAVEVPPDAPKTKSLLFAGIDGRIFDCLDQALPNSVLQEHQFWSMSIAKAIASNPSYHDGPPSNFCAASYGTVQGIQIMTIHLPYEVEELVSQACSVRLNGKPRSTKEFFTKD